MSASKSLLLGVLRIITPEEISDLTTTSKGNRRIHLDEIIDHFLEGRDMKTLFSEPQEEAEVIELNRETTSTEETVDYQECFSMLNNFYESPIAYRKKICDTLTDERGRKNDTSIFILNEKERFKKNQAKLKLFEIKDLYNKTSKVTINKNVKQNPLKAASYSGILVNKKQR